MCASPPISYVDLPGPHEVQVPSLWGINIPQLDPCRMSSSIEAFSVDSSHPFRPSLHRIDTDRTAHSKTMLQQDGIGRAMGHRHSRSLDIPTTPSLSPIPDSLDSAVSDSFLSTWPKENILSDKQELPPLPGLYISQLRRADNSSARDPPCLSTLPSLATAINPSSPLLDSFEDVTDSEDDIESEDAWNLVPYDISWGSSYYGYREGTLPGPDGKCIFLRSPTPLKYQRTGQACEKCRERKAKCSGNRPSCARCTSRGLTCEYAPDVKRAKSEDLSRLSSAVPKSNPPNPTDHLLVTGTGRVRSNTECGSHGARGASISSIELRRRHSTIGLPLSPSFSPSSLSRQGLREPRLARRASRSHLGYGFNGRMAPLSGLEPTIDFPSYNLESSRQPHSLPQSSAPLELHSLSLSEVSPTNAATHLSGQEMKWEDWDVQSSFSHDSFLLTPSHSLPHDLLENPNTHKDFPASQYGTSAFLQTLSDDTTQSQSFLASGCEDAFLHGCNSQLNFDTVEASCVYMLAGEDMPWSFDNTTQLKDEGARFLSENIPPQVTVINHEPEFHYFDQCEDRMMPLSPTG